MNEQANDASARCEEVRLGSARQDGTSLIDRALAGDVFVLRGADVYRVVECTRVSAGTRS